MEWNDQSDRPKGQYCSLVWHYAVPIKYFKSQGEWSLKQTEPDLFSLN